MMPPMKLTLPLFCAALLSACSSGGGGDSTLDFIERSEDAQGLATRLNDIPGTAFDAIPTSGSATFNGVASIFIDPVIEADNDDILLIGDTEVVADFGEGSVTGQIDNLQGLTNLTLTGGDEVAVTGEITIGDDISIIGNDPDGNLTSRPNDFFADYAGDLTIDGDTVALDGTIDGQFLGTRVDPADGLSTIRGIRASGVDDDAVINGGDAVPVDVEIFGENG